MQAVASGSVRKARTRRADRDAVGGDRRAQQVAGEALEGGAVGGVDEGGGVKGKAVEPTTGVRDDRRLGRN